MLRSSTIILFTTFITVICQQPPRPWYLPSILDLFEPSTPEEIRSLNISCSQECSTTMDCDNGLSCFHATNDNKGCCLMALKPNETGCLLDDQCKRACESTVCDKAHSPSRCLCEKGRHFLFNKCWKKCPDFAHSEPVLEEGFSRCVLKTDLKTAINFMRRQRRQMRSNFC